MLCGISPVEISLITLLTCWKTYCKPFSTKNALDCTILNIQSKFFRRHPRITTARDPMLGPRHQSLLGSWLARVSIVPVLRNNHWSANNYARDFSWHRILHYYQFPHNMANLPLYLSLLLSRRVRLAVSGVRVSRLAELGLLVAWRRR